MIIINNEKFTNVLNFNVNSVLVKDEYGQEKRFEFTLNELSFISVVFYKDHAVFHIHESGSKTSVIAIDNGHKKIIDSTVSQAISMQLLTNISYEKERDDVSLNTWLLSLDDNHRKLILEDKWMLAEQAFKAGMNIGRSATYSKDGDFLIPFFLTDACDPSQTVKHGSVTFSEHGVSIKVDGYVNDANLNEIIFLEQAHGQLNLRLYEDKNNEEPTKLASFTEAKE